MSKNGIMRAVDGFKSGLYSELEFFNLLTMRTYSDEIRYAYDAIPDASKARFLLWIVEYTIHSDAVCIGEAIPKLEIIEAFKRLNNDN